MIFSLLLNVKVIESFRVRTSGSVGACGFGKVVKIINEVGNACGIWLSNIYLPSILSLPIPLPLADDPVIIVGEQRATNGAASHHQLPTAHTLQINEPETQRTNANALTSTSNTLLVVCMFCSRDLCKSDYLLVY